MPFRIDPSDGKCIQVQRTEGWERFKCHDTAEGALAQLAALAINVDKGEWVLKGSFVKQDDDRQLAFGWAYTTEIDGALVVDHSGDFIDKAALPDLEDAAYAYVLESREADENHETFEGIAKLVESLMLTPEKAEAMGIVTKRIGWWVGFHIDDPGVWAKVKDGTYQMFSIRGTGTREEV